MTNDPRVEAAARAINEAYRKMRPGVRFDKQTREALAIAALESADAAAWRPIDEAPEGDHSVIIDMWASGERYTDCRWAWPTYGGQKGVYGWVYQSGYDCDGPVHDWVPRPTRWRPLPTPPESCDD